MNKANEIIKAWRADLPEGRTFASWYGEEMAVLVDALEQLQAASLGVLANYHAMNKAMAGRMDVAALKEASAQEFDAYALLMKAVGQEAPPQANDK